MRSRRFVDVALPAAQPPDAQPPDAALPDTELLAGLACGHPVLAAAFVRRFQRRVFGLAASRPPSGQRLPSTPVRPSLDTNATLPCAVAPGDAPGLVDAVRDGGGRLVEPVDAEGLVWTHGGLGWGAGPPDVSDADGLAKLLRRAPGIRWVQLPFAGVDGFLAVVDSSRTWTSAKGAYGEPVAEHALALGLAGLRRLPARARARTWGRQDGRRLMGARVTIVGGGSITTALLGLLAPFRVEVTVVRRHVAPLPGTRRVLGPDRLHQGLEGADLVVLALALTPETTGLIGKEELDRMGSDAWLVNVARGAHVVTDALVDALGEARIGGAALDVTDPEPLPDGHPLWALDNCLITPHVANTWEMAEPLLAERIRLNVERYRQGEPLLGLVDTTLGY